MLRLTSVAELLPKESLYCVSDMSNIHYASSVERALAGALPPHPAKKILYHAQPVCRNILNGTGALRDCGLQQHSRAMSQLNCTGCAVASAVHKLPDEKARP
jgi:hypothetical protein